MAQINDTTAYMRSLRVNFAPGLSYWIQQGYVPASFALAPPVNSDNAFAPYTQRPEATQPEPFAGYGEIEARVRSLLDIDQPIQG